MTRSTRLALSIAVAAGLATPAVAGAQSAVPRPASSGSSSGSSGSSSGSSSSGSAGSSTGPTSGGAGEAQRPASAKASGESQRRAPAGSKTSGSAISRGSASSSSSRPSGVTLGSTSSSSGRTGATRGSAFGTDSSRDRDGRPIRGSAVERTRGAVSFIDYPLFGPWGRWYPYYGLGYGYVSFDPWGSYYGSTRYGMGRYGYYGPYDPYGGYYGGGGYYSGYDDDRNESARETGSIRLRAKPSEAKVYINGALVGTVDDFDGLSNHLELEGGVHVLELRLDGYESYTGEITVDVGKTRTERLTLKKKR